MPAGRAGTWACASPRTSSATCTASTAWTGAWTSRSSPRCSATSRSSAPAGAPSHSLSPEAQRLGANPSTESAAYHRAKLPEVVDELGAFVEASERQLDRHVEGDRRGVAVRHLGVE